MVASRLALSNTELLFNPACFSVNMKVHLREVRIGWLPKAFPIYSGFDFFESPDGRM